MITTIDKLDDLSHLRELLLNNDRKVNQDSISTLESQLLFKIALLDKKLVSFEQHLQTLSKEVSLAKSRFSPLENKTSSVEANLDTLVNRLSNITKEVENVNINVGGVSYNLTKEVDHITENLSSISNVIISTNQKIEQVDKKTNSPDKFATNLFNSKEQVIDVIGPLVGKIIKRGLAEEMEKISARIESATKKLTSVDYFKAKFSGLFTSKKEKSLIAYGYPELINVMLIDLETGLLLGQYSTDTVADSDIIAGMFNAIKSFSETAFDKTDSGLNLINYDDYRIKLKQYGTIYYAIIFKGRDHLDFHELMIDEVDYFTENTYTKLIKKNKKEELGDALSLEMYKYFNNTCEKLEKKLSQLAQ